MRIIGLTGGIACGKSNISDALLALGAPLIDGDKLSRELTLPGGLALPALRETFGPSYFFPDGSLNRKALGALVFSDPKALAALDAVMQPLLKDLILYRIEEARYSGADVCFLDMPLLFEKKLDSLCDTVWCAWIPESLQLRRLMERDGLSEDEAMARIRSQLSADEKAARSAVVIPTTGTLEESRALVPPLYRQELEAAAAPSVRRRRSARYETVPGPLPVTPAPVPPSAPPVSPVRPPMQPVAIPPEVMDRPSGARKTNREPRKRKAEWRLPSALLTGLIVACFAILAMFTADSLMNAYLTRSRETREAAYRKVVDDHPLLYRDYIEKYAEEYNLHPAFVSAIIMNESSFRVRAESGIGARGLMQLMPDTAQWIARKLKVDGYSFERMYDAESNIRFGCWYLNYLCGLFRGDPVSVSCAYHAGQGTVTGWLSDSSKSKDGVSLLLDQLSDGPTKTYAGRVTQDYGIYKAIYFAESDSQSADFEPDADGSAL